MDKLSESMGLETELWDLQTASAGWVCTKGFYKIVKRGNEKRFIWMHKSFEIQYNFCIVSIFHELLRISGVLIDHMLKQRWPSSVCGLGWGTLWWCTVCCCFHQLAQAPGQGPQTLKAPTKMTCNCWRRSSAHPPWRRASSAESGLQCLEMVGRGNLQLPWSWESQTSSLRQDLASSPLSFWTKIWKTYRPHCKVCTAGIEKKNIFLPCSFFVAFF